MLYALLELILEVHFEMEVFAQNPQLRQSTGHDSSLRVATVSMLVAHWLYWASAILKGLHILLEWRPPTTQSGGTFGGMDQRSCDALCDQLRTTKRSTIALRYAGGTDIATGRRHSLLAERVLLATGEVSFPVRATRLFENKTSSALTELERVAVHRAE